MSTQRSIERLRFPVEAVLTLPSSKSHANRALICACLAEGETHILCLQPCDDILLMIDSLCRMGFDIEWDDERKGMLRIIGMKRLHSSKQHFLPPSGEGSRMGAVVLDCKNAGTVLRFVLSLTALIPGEWILRRDASLQKRPIDDLLKALRALGAEISVGKDIHVKGGNLQGSALKINAGISSQFLSSLLLIAPLLPQGLKLETEGRVASELYIEFTRKVMKDFGVETMKKSNTFFIQKSDYVPPHRPHSAPPSGAPLSIDMEREGSISGGRSSTFSTLSNIVHKDDSYKIEGDWSAAGSWLVLNMLTQSRLSFSNLKDDSMQPDRRLPEYIARLQKKGDLTIDCSGVPDQVMNLAVLAACRMSKTKFIGISSLRAKECDRLSVLCRELSKAGICIEEQPDGFLIDPSKNKPRKHEILLDPSADHRMVIAFSLLALLQGSISILNADCVSKSYPDFFTDLSSVSPSSRPIVIVGMRGAGKTALAKKLAKKIGLRCLDSDKLFEQSHGSIAAYVSKHGWPAFRRQEEEIIAENLETGIVFSLGGGAVESQRTRRLLKERAVVLWLQATKKALLHHLSYRERLALTKLSHEEEVHELLVKRSPQYREIATIMLSPTLRYSEQVPFALRELEKFMHTYR